MKYALAHRTCCSVNIFSMLKFLLKLQLKTTGNLTAVSVWKGAMCKNKPCFPHWRDFTSKMFDRRRIRLIFLKTQVLGTGQCRLQI